MKDKPNDQARLLHMADAITEIDAYVAGMDYEAFAQDSKTRFASIKQLEIIGEAAYHLSAALKETHSEVQWSPIIALRHILVHEYYGIQSDILWRIITVHLPTFKAALQNIITP